jgi:hypothetical protein
MNKNILSQNVLEPYSELFLGKHNVLYTKIGMNFAQKMRL